MEIVLVLFLLVIPIACAFGCYRLALSKGRGAGLWGALGFLFVLVALLIIALLPPVKADSSVVSTGS